MFSETGSSTFESRPESYWINLRGIMSDTILDNLEIAHEMKAEGESDDKIDQELRQFITDELWNFMISDHDYHEPEIIKTVSDDQFFTEVKKACLESEYPITDQEISKMIKLIIELCEQ